MRKIPRLRFIVDFLSQERLKSETVVARRKSLLQCTQDVVYRFALNKGILAPMTFCKKTRQLFQEGIPFAFEGHGIT